MAKRKRTKLIYKFISFVVVNTNGYVETIVVGRSDHENY
jgi:hypothetical protein